MRHLAIALAILLGCAPLSTIGTHGGEPSICSRTNYRAFRVEVVLTDDALPRHIQYVGNADVGGHVCAVWDLPGQRGRWGYVTLGVRGRTDTTWDAWFWAAGIR